MISRDEMHLLCTAGLFVGVGLAALLHYLLLGSRYED